MFFDFTKTSLKYASKRKSLIVWLFEQRRDTKRVLWYQGCCYSAPLLNDNQSLSFNITWAYWRTWNNVTIKIWVEFISNEQKGSSYLFDKYWQIIWPHNFGTVSANLLKQQDISSFITTNINTINNLNIKILYIYISAGNIFELKNIISILCFFIIWNNIKTD